MNGNVVDILAAHSARDLVSRIGASTGANEPAAPTARQATEWTSMAEAISFISATLAEPFAAARGNSLYWSASPAPLDGAGTPYQVCVRRDDGDKISITVCFGDFGNDSVTARKLYAIVGWGVTHEHKVEAL